jgi:hypothetical protein
MGEKITRDNIDEFITSYIDREINNPALVAEVDGFLRDDETLRKKYNTELLTKNFIKSKLPVKEVPRVVFNKIRVSIDDLIAESSLNHKSVLQTEDHPIYTSSTFFEYLKKIIATPVRVGRFAVPRYSFAVVLILIIIGSSFFINRNNPRPLNPYIADGLDNSLMVQAMNNFHKILKGEIKAQINSTDAAQVKSYLKSSLDYDVYIPNIENCELVGAVCNEYNGQKVAHIIYHSGNDIFYICETSTGCIKHRVMEIPEPVHNEIMSHKFYMCDKVDKDKDCTMLLWYTGNIVCASVSTMPKQQMYTAFTNFK